MNIAFIPVRGGSKSIPLKNIKILNGKPLVYWTLRAAVNSKYIDKVVVATDSPKIKDTVLRFKFDKVEIYDRDPKNAQDISSTESVILEYINFAKLNLDDKFVLIQATSPLLKEKDIDGMFEKLENTNADSIFSVVREKQFHWIETDNGINPINYDPQNRPRRQEFRGLLSENGACYISSVGNILNSKCRISGNLTFYELPPETAYEIDEEIDFKIIEGLMKYQ